MSFFIASYPCYIHKNHFYIEVLTRILGESRVIDIGPLKKTKKGDCRR
jgi:hypothetical protein